MSTSVLAAFGVLLVLASATFGGPLVSAPARARQRHGEPLEPLERRAEEQARSAWMGFAAASFCLEAAGIVGFLLDPAIAAFWWTLVGCGSVLLLIALVLAARELGA